MMEADWYADPTAIVYFAGKADESMKRQNWLSLLLALLMAFSIVGASAEGVTFPEPWDTGLDVLWLLVPWEDKGVDLWFGVRFNEHRSEMANVQLSIDILEKANADWAEQFACLDTNGQMEPDQDNLMLMDISLTGPDGEAFTAEGLNLTMYVQTPDGWLDQDVQFKYVSAGVDEAYALTHVVQACPGEDDQSFVEDDFLSVDMNHFSPFAAYLEKPVVTPTPVVTAEPTPVPATPTPVVTAEPTPVPATPTPVVTAEPTPLPIGTATPVPTVPATGDGMQLSLLAGLMLMAAGLTVVFTGCLRKRSRG